MRAGPPSLKGSWRREWTGKWWAGDGAWGAESHRRSEDSLPGDAAVLTARALLRVENMPHRNPVGQDGRRGGRCEEARR